MTTADLHIFAVRGMGEVQPGDDLASLICQALQQQGRPLLNGDVVVITQKVVSKAEGRLVDLNTIEPSALARTMARQSLKDARYYEVVLRESRRIVKMARGICITETHTGLICANAGVDESNVPGEHIVALLPEDPDRSAQALCTALEQLSGVRLAVIISDTFGRPGARAR